MIGGVYHFAIDRKPVGVHVQYAHEHRQLNTAAVEIFVFVGFFKGNNGAVGRGHNGIVAVAFEHPARRTEEIHHQQVEHRRDGRSRNRPPQRAHPYPQRSIDYQQDSQQRPKDIRTFMVDFHSHWRRVVFFFQLQR